MRPRRRKFLANEITDPDEYARVYGLAEQVYAGWSDYRVKTDPIGRHIPVFRLKPRSRLVLTKGRARQSPRDRERPVHTGSGPHRPR